MQDQMFNQSWHPLDPRVARTEHAIRKALLTALNSGKDLASLTVSEIARQAGVTRKTFYVRVGSLEQLVESLVYDLFQDIALEIDDERLKMPIARNSLSMSVLHYCQAHQSVLGPLVRQCSASLFMKPLTKVLTQMLGRVRQVNQTPTLGSFEQAYLITTIASVIHGVLRVWVERGFCDAPDQIANFTDTLLIGGLQNILLADGGA